MKRFWVVMMALLVSVVNTGCDDENTPPALTQYGAYMLALAGHASDIEDEVDHPDFVLPGQIFYNAPSTFDTEGSGESAARGSTFIDPDGWLIGIWAVSQEATYTGTIIVGFRPNDDNTEVEVVILLSEDHLEEEVEEEDTQAEYDISFAVYIENILEDVGDLGEFDWEGGYMSSPGRFFLGNMDEPTTLIDQCPATGGPALKLESADVDFGIDAHFGDDVYLRVPDNVTLGGADNLEGPTTMLIVTYQRCHDKQFAYEWKEFSQVPLSFRDASEMYEAFSSFHCENAAETMGAGAKDDPIDPTCNGDFSDDFMEQEIRVDGYSTSTDYEIEISVLMEEGDFYAVGSGGSEPYWIYPGTGYTEVIEFYCDGGDGCNSKLAVANGIAAAVNADSNLVTAQVEAGVPTGIKGEPDAFVILTARGAGWPLNFYEDHVDLIIEETFAADTDLQLLNTVLSNIQFMHMASIWFDEFPSVPESAMNLLPEEPAVGASTTLEGHFVLGCANYPEGYIEGNSFLNLVFFEYSVPLFENPVWLPVGVEWVFNYVNCQIQFRDTFTYPDGDQFDLDLFGVSGNPTFFLEGTFANFYDLDSLPLFIDDEIFLFDAGFTTEALGTGYAWNPAIAMGENDTPIFFEAGAEASLIDVNARSAYQMTSSEAQFLTKITADGGMCVNGTVARNFDGSGNDSCVPAVEGGETYYAPPLFSYFFFGDCSMNPNGGGFSGVAPLLLAIGLALAFERRRRKAASRI